MKRGALQILSLLVILILIGIACWPALRPTTALPEFDRSAVAAAMRERLDELERKTRAAPTAENWGQLGMFYGAHFATAPSLECFAAAIELAPNEFRWRYYYAVGVEETDWVAAGKAYEAAAALDDSYAPLHYRYGNLLLHLSRPADAAQHFQRANEIEPKDPRPLVGWARTLLLRNQRERATKAFQQAADKAPWYRPAHDGLARIHHRNGNESSALRHSQQAARLPVDDPGMPDPLLSEMRKLEAASRSTAEKADRLFAQGDVQGAYDEFMALTSSRPDMPGPLLGLARCSLRLGNPEVAAAFLEKATATFPDEADAHYELGLSLEALAEQKRAEPAEASAAVQEAVAAYRRCVEIQPGHVRAHFALGLLWERFGKSADAIKAYREAVAASPGFAPAQLALGVLLLKKDRIDEALEFIRNAARLAPGDPVPQGFLKQALAAQEKQGDKSPKDP